MGGEPVIKEQHDGWRVLEDGRVQREVDKRTDGWWIVEAVGSYDANYCWNTRIRQVRAGEYLDLETFKSPQPTREDAERLQYWDHLPGYWEHGLAVYADHCLECGKYAKVLAFDYSPYFAWRVTECKKCGIRDSRTYKKERL